MSRPTIYLMPVSFGYGPAALAIAVAEALHRKQPGVRVIGIADGLALELLAGSEHFAADHVVAVEEGAVPAQIGEDRDAVCVGFADFDRLDVAHARGAFTVLVDPLFWMWPDPPGCAGSVDRYLALQFPGIEEQAQRCGLAQNARFRIVPQVVEHALALPRTARRQGVLLNLGGGVAPGVDTTAFLAALVDVTANALTVTGDGSLLVATSTAVAARLAPNAPRGVEIRALSRADMIDQLGVRARLVTVPGQSILWEALAARTPTVLVPGSNYSQHRQAALYHDQLINVPVLGWADLPGFASAPAGLPEAQGLALAAEAGRAFATNAAARATLTDWLHRTLRQPPAAPELSPGSVWRDLTGAEVIAAEILSLLGDAIADPDRAAERDRADA
jgi:hypothetical protein